MTTVEKTNFSHILEDLHQEEDERKLGASMSSNEFVYF